MLKAVSYLRVSGSSQIEGDGFPRQRETCAAYAKANGLRIVDEFRDEAVSGMTEGESREGFSAMVERIAGNGVRVVIVERQCRLARETGVGLALVAQLARLGMRVVEAASGRDLTDASDPMMVYMMEQAFSFAAYEKRILVGRLAKARARIRGAAGRCEGRKPFGTREGEAETVARIVKLRGRPLRSIAAQLDSEGRATRSGRPWSAEAVRLILARNPVAKTRKARAK